jgi:iron-sulfur cluster assembly protein
MEATPSNPSSQPVAAPQSGETVCVAGIGAGNRSVPGKSGITIGDKAAERLEKMAGEQGSEAGLRVAVKGGGCSGMSYSLAIEAKPKEKDRVFARGQARVFVDPKSYIYLVGTVVEWEQKLMQAGFKLSNPQVKATCGCGDSFSV